MTIVALHQPDFLPYSGFFYKMAMADVLDLRIHDQFVDRGYQRRVKMRDRWQSIPIVGGATKSTQVIKDVRINPATTSGELTRAITGRYGGSPFWKARREAILDMIADIHTDRLWQFNLELILGVRDFLGIDTPVALSSPPAGPRNEGVLSILLRYPNPTYLSGTGARTYMGDCQDYTDAGVDVVFSKHRAVTGDSILSVIFDYEDPMSITLLEEDEIAS